MLGASYFSTRPKTIGGSLKAGKGGPRTLQNAIIRQYYRVMLVILQETPTVCTLVGFPIGICADFSA